MQAEIIRIYNVMKQSETRLSILRFYILFYFFESVKKKRISHSAPTKAAITSLLTTFHSLNVRISLSRSNKVHFLIVFMAGLSTTNFAINVIAQTLTNILSGLWQRLLYLQNIHILWHAVWQFVEALLYKPEGRGFDSRWCHSNFSLILILPVALWPWVWLSL